MLTELYYWAYCECWSLRGYLAYDKFFAAFRVVIGGSIQADGTL